MSPGESPIHGRPRPGRPYLRGGERRVARRIRYSSEEDVDPPEETSKKNVKWKDRKPLTLKYVDDHLQLNKVNMETVFASQDSLGDYRDKHGIVCQNNYRRVVRRAKERGMQVNAGKTVMICSSGAQSYVPRSHIFGRDGNRISSGHNMKVLGYHLSSRPQSSRSGGCSL